jgi:hypothetical protein
VPARWRLRSGNLGCLLFRAALPGNSRRRVPPLSSQRGLRGRDPQRRGGCLVVSVPGADERGASVFERVLDHANAELATMVDQAAITAEERPRMALNVWPRRTSDLVAPFADGGRFRSLTLKATETRLLPDAAWVAYEKGCRKTCRPDFRSSSSMSLEKSKNIPLVK